MNTKEEIVELLFDLGPSSAGVAKSLEILKITGHKLVCKECPIAVYLIANGVELVKGVGSMPGKRGWFWIDGEMWLASENPELQGVIDFISDFDSDLYPNCIKVPS